MIINMGVPENLPYKWQIEEAIDRLDQLRIDITKVENDDKVEREAYEIQQLLFKAMDVVKKLTI